MHFKVILFVKIVTLIALCRSAPAEQNNGKYQASEPNQIRDEKYRAPNEGKYNPKFNNEGRPSGSHDSAGRYMHQAPPYRHIHDNRELGKYVHIPYPYDGGYGPYSGSNIPYVHDARPYEHVSNADFKVPAIRLEYGFPEYEPQIPTTTKKPTTTTRRTTTTTTTTPRNILFNYDDEGRHKILHQEEKRKHNKYDHVYLTENGIYGEEQAKVHHRGGTHATGYYEYTGDDGQLYRVNYKSNNRGFMPEGEHIPTPPPVPEAIARALKYVDEKRRKNGEMPIFDHRGFRIDNMPKEMWDVIRKAQREIAEQDQRRRLYRTTTEDGSFETTTFYF